LYRLVYGRARGVFNPVGLSNIHSRFMPVILSGIIIPRFFAEINNNFSAQPVYKKNPEKT
jgi:hypothetical protein